MPAGAACRWPRWEHAQFQREAEVLASLNHRHIAGIYGLWESAGITALVMELVEREDLSQRIARGASPARRDAANREADRRRARSRRTRSVRRQANGPAETWLLELEAAQPYTKLVELPAGTTDSRAHLDGRWERDHHRRARLDQRHRPARPPEITSARPFV